MPNHYEKFIVPPIHARSKGAQSGGWYSDDEYNRQQINAAAMAAANRRRGGAGVDPGLVPQMPAKSGPTVGLNQGGSMFDEGMHGGLFGVGTDWAGFNQMTSVPGIDGPRSPGFGRGGIHELPDKILPTVFTGEAEGGVSRMGGFGGGDTEGEDYIMDARARWDANTDLGPTRTVSGLHEQGAGFSGATQYVPPKPWEANKPKPPVAPPPPPSGPTASGTGDFFSGWWDSVGSGFGNQATNRLIKQHLSSWWNSAETTFSGQNIYSDIEYLMSSTRLGATGQQGSFAGLSEEQAKKLVFEKYAKLFPDRENQIRTMLDYTGDVPFGTTSLRDAKKIEAKAASGTATVGESPQAYIKSLSEALQELAAGPTIDPETGAVTGDMGSAIDKLINITSGDLKLPEGYEVTYDPTTNVPIVNFVGGWQLNEDGTQKLVETQTGLFEKDKDGKDVPVTEMRPVRDMTVGRISENEVRQLNSALQQREIALGHVADYSAQMLGLNIKAQDLNMTSKQFRMELAHKGDELQLKQDQHASNDRFTEATITGIYKDVDGNEVTSLDNRELIAKLTGKMQIGTKQDWAKGETVPVMGDTIALENMRAELIGKFEGQDTISKQQFEAEVKGYIQTTEGRVDTFAREQFLELQRQARNEALTNAGLVTLSGLAELDEEGNPRYQMVRGERKIVLTAKAKQLEAQGLLNVDNLKGDIAFMQSLEQRQAELEADLLRAKQTGQMRVQKFNDDSGVFEGWVDVPTLEQQLFTNEEARKELIIGMEQAQSEEAIAQATHRRTMEAAQADELSQQRLAQLGYVQLPEGITSFADTSLRQTLEGRQAELALRQQAQRMGGVEQAAAGAPAEFFDQTRRMQGAEYQERLSGEQVVIESARNYTSGLRNAIQQLSQGNLSERELAEGIDVALNQPLPPSPAGMVWDTQGGVFRLREGYEGAVITSETQRVMEIVAPAMKARDRAETIQQGIVQFQVTQEMARREMQNRSANLRRMIEDADIVGAEEEAYLKQKAERELAEWEVKATKWQMVLQMIGNPTLLGMANRHGVLPQLEEDLQITIPHIPSAGTAGDIPTHNEWVNMDSENKQFREQVFVQETGQTVEQFHNMIASTAPAQMQTLQYATLSQ